MERSTGRHGTRVRVALVDRDPASRHALLSALAAVPDIAVRPVGMREVPDDHRVVIVAWVPRDAAHLDGLRTLAGRGLRVLVLGADWSRSAIGDALDAGAVGVVTHPLDVEGLAAAVHALAFGHVVISPDLLAVYRGTARDTVRPAADEEGLRVLDELTARELEVLLLLTRGLSTTEVADRLGITFATVKSHVSHSLPKIGARNRVQAVLKVTALRLAELAAYRSDGDRLRDQRK